MSKNKKQYTFEELEKMYKDGYKQIAENQKRMNEKEAEIFIKVKNLNQWKTIAEILKLENEYQKNFEKMIHEIEEERMKNTEYRMQREKFEEWLQQNGCLI